MEVSCPHTFSFGSHNSYPWVRRGKKSIQKRSEIYPKNLSAMYLVVWGSKNNKGVVGITQIIQKEKLF